MPSGIRTAPTVAELGVTKFGFTIHAVDFSGDNGTAYFELDAIPTDAELESVVDAYQAATQASVWKVSATRIWEGGEQASNAASGSRDSVADGVNLLLRNTTINKAQSPRIIAPAPEVMQGANDIPDPASTPFGNLVTAIGAILSDYTGISAQYTERTERRNNPRVEF